MLLKEKKNGIIKRSFLEFIQYKMQFFNCKSEILLKFMILMLSCFDNFFV